MLCIIDPLSRPHSEGKIADYGFALYNFFLSERVSKVNTPQPREDSTSTMYDLPIIYIYVSKEKDE